MLGVWIVIWCLLNCFEFKYNRTPVLQEGALGQGWRQLRECPNTRAALVTLSGDQAYSHIV